MYQIQHDDLNYAWIHGEKVFLKESMDVINPATGKPMARVPRGGKALTEQAIDAAAKAFPTWSKLPADQRAGYLLDWADRILADQERLAWLLSTEQGKPLDEARGEIYGTTVYIRWYAEEGKRAYGEIIPASRQGQRLMVFKEAIGVVGLIPPANFPSAIVANKVAPALAAGCTFVLKPAEQTPLIAIALLDHLMATGLPAGVANVVTGVAEEIGATLSADPRVRKIGFTGSTEVGKILMRQAADNVKRLTLELGGNAPVVVFPDANLEKAVDAIMGNKFENCGQVCNGINLIYAHESIRAELVEKLAEKVRSLKVGVGTEEGTQVGPMIDLSYRDKVETLVRDAVDKGAKLVVGGNRVSDEGLQDGYFYAPTLLDEVTADMELTKREIFGPVAPVLSFTDEAEVLARCNNTPYGLAAYVFTKDAARMFRMIDGLEVGNLAINGTSLANPQSPFGGVKESGIGRVGGHQGLEEYMELKYVALTLE
ncbi:NAD-dependent succinate-semialdehyde dehydrogenase [Brevibacillus centrosporus]|uniref:Succinate-semialdehyde dehydrogenase / glutarate-semialdehyde dehydrogenase n=1 Tax=Brevibacillus centrosporus TaxID=54910 RepID=A0A1I3X9P2_9BACL|nr:NAD-dependent succinate-semialdehyde dehydrogenase [Brevibacillus centrosporus]SFK16325.1 succinate-semialdehyde dehydrogenase / glutarate-semialdehyde dehydrogenase [Brevibacillus centrosporus]